MSNTKTEVFEKIEAQQKGHENTDIFALGEQLKEIAEECEHNAEIISQDLDVEEMNISKAAKKLKEYADKNHKGNFFCITPQMADDIIRKFYGIPTEKPKERTKENMIDLESFL